MMELVPALSLLIAFVIIIGVLLRKFTGEQLSNMFSGKNFLLFAAVFLFCVLVIVHLFQAQTWTADVLKVIVGVLVGAGASYASDKSKKDEKDEDKGFGVEVGDSQFGDSAKIAGRDINETIQNMQGDIQQLKDAVINQNNYIEKALTNLTSMGNNLNDFILQYYGENDETYDYLINTIHDRFYGTDQNRIAEALEIVINTWQNEGWKLVSFTSDYQGVDGLVLLFIRPTERKDSQILYYHGSRMEDFNR